MKVKIVSAKRIFLVSLLIVCLWLRLYKIGFAFPFDYDQEFYANTAYNFFKNHKLSLIGQELSFEGFFLGPLHSWIELIPYGFCSLQPNCTPYFFVAFGSAIIIFLYFVLEKIFGKGIAVISTVFFSISFAAISFERVVNSNFFLFPTTIVVIYCLYQYFRFKEHYLVLGGLFSGLAIVNFNPVFVFYCVAFFFISLTRKKRHLKTLIFSFTALLVNYLPLVLFNIRHENLLVKSFGFFAKSNIPGLLDLERPIIIAKDIILPFYTNFFFQSRNVFLQIFLLAVFLFGVRVALIRRGAHFRFLPVSILITFIGFVFYNSNISDYYFLPSLLPMVILVALSLQKNRYLLMLFLVLFLYTNLQKAHLFYTPVNLIVKQQVINHIHEDTNGQSFKLYNVMPLGLNTGYTYLFKLSNKEPQENGQNLYVLNFQRPEEFELDTYYKTFRGQDINLKIIGNVEIVSIK